MEAEKIQINDYESLESKKLHIAQLVITVGVYVRCFPPQPILKDFALKETLSF